MYDSTEKKLDDLYRTRDVSIAWSILDDYDAGKTSFTAAQDLITRITTMVRDGRVNFTSSPERTKKYAEVLEAMVITKSGAQAWKRTADAQYALRILAETPDFAELGYDQSKIEELANHFNKKHADREYSIGGFSYTSPKTGEIIKISPMIIDRAA
jgi:hypothetical protein